MCGRYAATSRPDDLVEEFELARPVSGGSDVLAPPEPNWNVAPTDPVLVVLERTPRGGEPDATPVRGVRTARWGLVPSWAKDVSIGSRLINARMETVGEKPAFRKAFASRRCILPADGYYEWYASTQATTPAGKPVKQPFFITPKDGRPLAMAGLYELWRDRSVQDGEPGAWVWSATVITTTAQDDLGHLHDRMPLLVARESYDRWLDPAWAPTQQDLEGVLVPASPGLLRAYAVSTRVNSVKNNGPELLDPLPLEDVPADVREVVGG